MKQPRQVARLPASVDETAAREWVRREIVYWRSHKLPLRFLGDAVDFLDPADARRFARERFKNLALSDPHNLMVIVDWARAGWDIAQDALADLILQFENSGTQKPAYLAAYTMDIVAGRRAPRISGPKKEEDFFRNVLIVTLVARVHEIFGLPIIGRSVRRMSCCAVVGGEFSLGEDAVRAIWKVFGRPNLSF